MPKSGGRSGTGSRGPPTRKPDLQTPRAWAGYYRWTEKRPPRELLVQALNHVDWERRVGRGPRTAIDLGFGAGNDTLELLRRGWTVLAIDQQPSAVKFLTRRVPPAHRARLTCLVAPMEGLELPPADLVYASFSLPFCAPHAFPALWKEIRSAIRPGGHFAGQLFGNLDQWHARSTMTFVDEPRVRRLARGLRTELLRETVEEGRSLLGPKHWHYFDLILGQPPARRHRHR